MNIALAEKVVARARRKLTYLGDILAVTRELYDKEAASRSDVIAAEWAVDDQLAECEMRELELAELKDREGK